jgi:hypothetical protein
MVQSEVGPIIVYQNDMICDMERYKWWFNFCAYSRKQFPTTEALNIYLRDHGMQWVETPGSVSAGTLIFNTPEDYTMFILKWV